MKYYQISNNNASFITMTFNNKIKYFSKREYVFLNKIPYFSLKYSNHKNKN